MGRNAPAELLAAGPLQLRDLHKIGFFCSSQCSGSIVLKTFDAITRMRDKGQILIGGFHSLMEWECLASYSVAGSVLIRPEGNTIRATIEASYFFSEPVGGARSNTWCIR